MKQTIKQITAVYETAPEYVSAGKTERFCDSRSGYEWFKKLSTRCKEHFVCLHLDSKNQVLCVDEVSVGSLNAAIVHPREVFKAVLLSSASSVLFIHNHPSGDPKPSAEDIALTARLKQAGELLGVRVLDHIIVGDNTYYSFADQGTL